MMRRSVLRLLGLGGLFAGTGGTAPPPAGYIPPSLPGQAAGPSAGIVRARLVIVGGPNEGVYVYSGTPGPGNPPIVSISNSFTDPFGNPTVLYLASYGASGSYAELFTNQLILFSGGSGFAGLMYQSAAGVITINSGGTNTDTAGTQAVITMESAGATGGNPTILLGAGNVKLTSGASAQIPNTRPSITALGSTWNATTASQANTNFNNIINFLTAIGVST